MKKVLIAMVVVAGLLVVAKTIKGPTKRLYSYELWSDSLGLIHSDRIRAANPKEARIQSLNEAAVFEVVQAKELIDATENSRYPRKEIVMVDSVYVFNREEEFEISKAEFSRLEDSIRPIIRDLHQATFERYHEAIEITRVEARERAETVDSIQSYINSRAHKLRVTSDEFSNGLEWVYPRRAPKYVNYDAFYLYYARKEHSVQSLRLKVQYEDDDWLFIRGMVLKSGELEPLTVYLSDVKRDHDGGRIWEWTDFAIDEGTHTYLQAAVRNGELKVRLLGSDYRHDFNLSRSQLSDLSLILELHQADRFIQEMSI